MRKSCNVCCLTFYRRQSWAVGLEWLLIASSALVIDLQPSHAADELTFVDVTEAAGLDAPLAGIMGHGAAWGDVDNDGRPDLFVGGFCDRPDEEYAPADGPVSTRFLRQTEDGRFVLDEGLPGGVFGRTSGAVFADLDNDGGIDLYVAHNARPGASGQSLEPEQAAAKQQLSQLFRNRLGGFDDASAASGACLETLYSARNVAPIDIDGDALLDLLVIEDRFRQSPRSTLFRNLGELRFEDDTAEYGLPDDLFGLGHAVADLNGDRRPDLFIGHSNRLFLSRADGRYREPIELRDVFAWEPLHDEDWTCGESFGDLDRDGDFDLVLSVHCETARNRVYLNEGFIDEAPRFRDVTMEVGLPDAIPVRCPHVEIQDFDNDGWPDLYFSAAWQNEDGMVQPLIFLHRGLERGLPRFDPPQPIEPPMIYYPAGPTCDYDGDGRVDLFLVNWYTGDCCRLLRNETSGGHWLTISVEGRTFNRMGVGSRIHLYEAGRAHDADALVGVREIQVGIGYASGQIAVAHFGLGDREAIDVVVSFPTGESRVLENVAADQRLSVAEHSE